MPDHFDQEERALIRARILESGARLFRTRGVKATTVAEIARAVGIAKGSFYAFFSSKEALLADLLDAAEREIRKVLLLRLADLDSPSSDDVALAILDMVRVSAGHPLLASLMSDPDFNRIYRTLPEGAKDHLVASDVAFAAQVLGLVADKGLRARVAPAAAAGLFKTIFLAVVAPREIGEEVHGEVVELLAKAVAASVFEPRTGASA